jgi:hypothetical protein
MFTTQALEPQPRPSSLHTSTSARAPISRSPNRRRGEDEPAAVSQCGSDLGGEPAAPINFRGVSQ